MRERTYGMWAAGLAVMGFVLDQASKYGIFRWLASEQYLEPGSVLSFRYTLVKNVFHLLAEFTPIETAEMSPLVQANGQYVPRVNHGALFGMGGEHTWLANAGFALVSAIAAIAIVVWLWRGFAGHDKWLSVCLGLILGGTLGNLYDRIVFGGVRDFMHFKLEGVIDWPVFNFADCCLVCGAILLLVQALFAPAPEPTPTPKESASV